MFEVRNSKAPMLTKFYDYQVSRTTSLMLNLVLPVSSQDNYLAQIFSHSLAFEKNEFFELLLNRYSYL